MQGNELVQFAEFEEPGLKAGDYEVRATLSLKNLPASAFAASPHAASRYEDTKYLRVEGDQYALSPGTVESVYPPEGVSGAFSRNLPHVVLTRATLPWERTISNAVDHTPWMTVLLLTNDELLEDGVDASQPLTAATRPGPDGEAINCRVLKLPQARWKSLAPTAKELTFLAHVRKSSTALRADNELDERKVGLVMGNRLPPEGKGCWAFLVSVENRISDLPQGEAADVTELVVLHSWRFFAEASPRSFGAAIVALDRRVGLSLACPPDAPEAAALSMGYVPASHSLRVGGNTWSWYRGPFTPYGTQRVLKKDSQDPIRSADSVLFYDPELGMMDTSCAAAWTLGRLTALNDTAFAQAVQKSLRKKVRSTVERARFQLTFGRLPGRELTAASIRTRVEMNLANGLVAALPKLGGARTGLAEAVAPHLSHEPELLTAAPLLTKVERVHFMKSALGRVERIQELHALDEQLVLRGVADEGRDDLQLSEDAKERWLGDAAVAKQVPFHYLVPHQDMLPAESIRFFQVDPSWLEAFHDGAISIGRESETDYLHDAAFMPLLRSGVERSTAVARPQNHRLLLQGNATGQPMRPLSGLLLRSDALNHWPDMEIEGKVGGRTVKTLRQQRIGPVLLCLFAELVDGVDIHQPSEGVHFGFPLKKEQGDPEKYWRTSEGDIDKTRRLEQIPFRNVRSGVLDILKLLEECGGKGSDELALQMVVGADRIVFTIASA